MKTKTKKIPSETPAACADLEAIAARAYAIWQEQGQPDGHDFDHWIEAEAHFQRCRDDDNHKQNDPQQ